MLNRVMNLTGMLAAVLVACIALSPSTGYGTGADESSPEHESATEAITKYDVILTSFGDRQIAIIKETRAVIDGIGLADAKKLVENAPSLLKEGVSNLEAQEIKESFEAVGATIEVSRSDQERSQAVFRLDQGTLLASFPQQSNEVSRSVPGLDAGTGIEASHSVTIRAAPQVNEVLEKVRDKRGISLSDFEKLFDWLDSVRDDERTAADVLVKLSSYDQKLAEALMLFRLRTLGGIGGRDEIVKAAFTHYVVNAKEPLATMPAPGPLQFAEDYGRSMVVKLDDDKLPDANETSLTRLRAAGISMNKTRYGRPDVLPTPVFEFIDDAPNYRKVNAMWMAEYAALAYRDKEFVREQLDRWGHTDTELKWIENTTSDTQLFVAATERSVVLSFRGTEVSLRDFGTDLSFLRVQADGGQGQVHRGFKKSLDSIWSMLKSAMAGDPDEREVFVTGHSLGAALAQLAAFRMQRAGMRVTAVYAFGSPLVGDRHFTKAYDTALGSRTFLHINHDDIVTQIPPRWLGFERAAFRTARKFIGKQHEIATLAGHDRSDDPPPGISVSPDGTVDLDDPRVREEVEYRLTRAEEVLRQTTEYLRVSPDQVAGNFYSEEFDGGGLDDHGINQYLFKLGCAIVDEMWESESARANSPR